MNDQPETELLRHPRDKFLAFILACAKRACGIAFAGLTLHPIVATAEVINSASPASPEVSRMGVPTSSEIVPLETVSKNASDLVVEVSDPLTTSPSEITPNSEDAGDVPIEDAPSETPESNNAASTSSQNLGQRSRLTGDWGGLRSQLEDAGVTFDLEFTQFYQGLVSGSSRQIVPEGSQFIVVDEADGYGGRVDAFSDVDFGKLGLWQGGGFHTHLEYRYGPLAADLGNAFFATNVAMDSPFESPHTLVATSLYLSQQFGDRVSLLLGRINSSDLSKNDLFFSGWGIRRFQNTVFATPPSGLMVPVLYGAIANVRLDPVTLSLWVYDPDDRTQDYWPTDLFSNGVNVSLTTTYATKVAGRPTSISLTGRYSTKTGTNFSEVSEGFRSELSELQPSTKTGSYYISFQLSHLLHQNPGDPEQGWGLFLKGAIADGNPNYVQNSIIAGIGGTGLFPGRELDSFGLGYYYYNLSDALQDSLSDTFRRVSFGDEQGIEAYYSYAVTPWFYLTADVQYIKPPRSSFDDAFIAGVRANVRF